MNHPSMPHSIPNANVHKKAELMKLSSTITQLITDHDCCNERKLNKLDFSTWPLLNTIEIGSHCFMSVREVKLIGLEKLERVVIGRDCFSIDDPYGNKHCRFQLKKCPVIRELKMGCKSFSDSRVCEIENNDSLEVIEMGELNEWSRNFCDASLELKSDSDRMK